MSPNAPPSPQNPSISARDIPSEFFRSSDAYVGNASVTLPRGGSPLSRDTTSPDTLDPVFLPHSGPLTARGIFSSVGWWIMLSRKKPEDKPFLMVMVIQTLAVYAGCIANDLTFLLHFRRRHKAWNTLNHSVPCDQITWHDHRAPGVITESDTQIRCAPRKTK